MRFEKKGYEFRSFKLGQKVVYKGEKVKIIGFDEDDLESGQFIIIKNNRKSWRIGDDGYKVTSVLEKYVGKKALYVYSSEITLCDTNE